MRKNHLQSHIRYWETKSDGLRSKGSNYTPSQRNSTKRINKFWYNLFDYTCNKPNLYLLANIPTMTIWSIDFPKIYKTTSLIYSDSIKRTKKCKRVKKDSQDKTENSIIKEKPNIKLDQLSHQDSIIITKIAMTLSEADTSRREYKSQSPLHRMKCISKNKLKKCLRKQSSIMTRCFDMKRK